MVYCQQCGAKNEDDAEFCAQCGASLYPAKAAKEQGDTCFGSEGGVEEECFGLPHGGVIAGAILGIFMILMGVGLLFGWNIWIWIGPLTLIIIGLLMVAGAIYSTIRRR